MSCQVIPYPLAGQASYFTVVTDVDITVTPITPTVIGLNIYRGKAIIRFLHFFT